jgi:hypothetical protein
MRKVLKLYTVYALTECLRQRLRHRLARDATPQEDRGIQQQHRLRPALCDQPSYRDGVLHGHSGGYGR